MGNVPVRGPIAATGPFPACDDSQLGGSFRVVTDIAALNAIATANRKEGMWVNVLETGAVYRLNTAPWVGNINDWTVITNVDFINKDFVLYVDPVNGSDANPGTQLLPLQTLDSALLLVPTQWGKKARINLTAGRFDLPIGKSYVLGAGVGPQPEPLLIQGTMTTVLTRNLTAIAPGATRQNQYTVSGAALVAGAYRGHFLMAAANGGNDPGPVVRQILDNTTSSVILSEPVAQNFPLAITIQKPASTIGFGQSSGGGPIPAIRGLGNQRTLLELWGVELGARADNGGASVGNWDFEHLSLFFNGAWVDGFDGSTNRFKDITLACGTSGLIPDINAMLVGGGAASGYYNDYANGPGAYWHDCDQIFFDGVSTRITPGFFFVNGNLDTTFFFIMNGCRADFGALTCLSANFFVQAGAQVRVTPTANTGFLAGVCVLDHDGQFGFKVGGNSSLTISGVVAQNFDPFIQADASSTVIVGTPGNDVGLNSGGGNDAPTDTGVGAGRAVVMSGFSRLILCANTGFNLLGNQIGTLVGGAGPGTVDIDGLQKSWANVIAGVQQNNGSGAIFRTS